MTRGRLIALEGIDGSGKGTQSQLLVDALTKAGIATELFRFPQYETSFFGAEVGRYLHGDYGNLSEVNPKFSALLYALDRFEARDKLAAALAAGKTVICDRYTPSNVAHQSARVAPADRASLAQWIQHVEYEIFRLPKPDIVFLLDSSVASSQSLVKLKEKRSYTDKTHDLQEESKDHLQAALEQFRSLATTAANWKVIHCIGADGILRTPADIHEELLAFVHAKTP
ncbi:MAG TPA: hypothetical protein VGE08_06980 [Steroidobacter sp.]|uniref:hypothetical protein n=1 Tax=Steroidobacter sp. TaxID=1978227 RepID=UPI002EDA8550